MLCNVAVHDLEAGDSGGRLLQSARNRSYEGALSHLGVEPILFYPVCYFILQGSVNHFQGEFTITRKQPVHAVREKWLWEIDVVARHSRRHVAGMAT